MATMLTEKADHKNLPRSFRRLAYVILAVLLIGTIGYAARDGATITGAFTKTLLTLTHQNIGEEVGAAKGKLDLTVQFLGVILIWFAVWTTFDLALTGKFDEFVHERKMKKSIESLKHHYIVCGVGRVGFHVGRRLAQKGEKVLFIDKDKDVIERLTSKGHLVMEVGSIDEHVLLGAGVKKAKGIAIALGEDAKNLIILMTAKELNPKINAAVRVSNLKLLPRFKRAGADLIVIPEAVGGTRLADAMLGERHGDVIST